MRRRVVVTGIGAVSPNGIGREKFWDATRRGISGVRRITRFDPAGIPVQVAGEVAMGSTSRSGSAPKTGPTFRALYPWPPLPSPNAWRMPDSNTGR